MKKLLPGFTPRRANRLLAVDLNRQEARYILASWRRGSLSIQAIGATRLASGNGQDHSPSTVAERLRDALADHNVGRVPTLIALDRGTVEWEPMSLPPATDEELPGLVLNQLSQQLPSLGDQATVDFFAIPSTDGGRKVVAVALPASQRSFIDTVASQTGLTIRRIGVRALSAASLIRRMDPRVLTPTAASPMPEMTLTVDAAGDVVDLTLLQQGCPVLARTVRLSVDPRTPEGIARLVPELRRSFVAARLGGESSELRARIILFGDPAEWQGVIPALREGLGGTVEAIDPFVLLGLTPPPSLSIRGGFAGLLGMLVDESTGIAPSVDFLSPKRPSPPRDPRRPLYIGGAAAAAVILSAYVWVHSTFADVDGDIAKAAGDLKDLDAQIKRIEPRQKLAAAVASWQGGGVNWLDELRSLSERFPSSRDVVVLRMSMGPSRDGGGALTLQGVSRTPDAIERMERAIRNSTHEVQTPKVQDRSQDRSYPWQFETTVSVSRSMNDGEESADGTTGAARRDAGPERTDRDANRDKGPAQSAKGRAKS